MWHQEGNNPFPFCLPQLLLLPPLEGNSRKQNAYYKIYSCEIGLYACEFKINKKEALTAIFYQYIY